jgi:excisionase family DNA binding protein
MNENSEGRTLLTIPEVAEEMRVSHRTVFRWMSEGLLQVVRIGKVTRIRREDFDAFLEEHLTTEPRQAKKEEAS